MRRPPGHSCASASCRFHIHTHTDKHCISTVGEYYPSHAEWKPQTIGRDRLYETMVFELGEDDSPKSWEEIDFAAYNDRESAETGHEAMVSKYEV